MEKWAATHNLPFSLDRAPADRITFPKSRFAGLRNETRQGVSSGRRSGCSRCLEIGCRLHGLSRPGYPGRTLEKLIERERLASTGIGNGIAIPHPRDPLSQPPETPVITTCFLENR
jgi:PTS system nitrogen regulatory IIA component